MHRVWVKQWEGRRKLDGPYFQAETIERYRSIRMRVLSRTQDLVVERRAGR